MTDVMDDASPSSAGFWILSIPMAVKFYVEEAFDALARDVFIYRAHGADHRRYCAAKRVTPSLEVGGNSADAGGRVQAP